MDEETIKQVALQSGGGHQDVLREVALWFIMGVCSFLGYNIWQVTVSVERLVVELRHITTEGNKTDDQIKMMMGEIRDAQRIITSEVFAIAALDRRVEILEERLTKGSSPTLDH